MNFKKFGWLLLVALTLVFDSLWQKVRVKNGKLKSDDPLSILFMILQKNIVGDEGTVDLLIGAGSEAS